MPRNTRKKKKYYEVASEVQSLPFDEERYKEAIRLHPSLLTTHFATQFMRSTATSFETDRRMFDFMWERLDDARKAELFDFSCESYVKGGLVAFLLEKGLVPTAKHLYWPLVHNKVEDVKALLEHGVDLGGATPNTSEECLRLLLEKRCNPTDLMWKSLNFHSTSLKNFKFLIESGADVKAVDEKGRTPLICFLDRDNFRFEEHIEKMKLLLNAGAEVDDISYSLASNIGKEEEELILEHWKGDSPPMKLWNGTLPWEVMKGGLGLNGKSVQPRIGEWKAPPDFDSLSEERKEFVINFMQARGVPTEQPIRDEENQRKRKQNFQ